MLPDQSEDLPEKIGMFGGLFYLYCTVQCHCTYTRGPPILAHLVALSFFSFGLKTDHFDPAGRGL